MFIKKVSPFHDKSKNSTLLRPQLTELRKFELYEISEVLGTKYGQTTH